MIRVLVVDDNIGYLKLLRTFFATTEIDAYIATNAEDALDAMNERSFDLVLTDLNMPGTAGIELALMVKEKDHEMPIIMMTACIASDTADRAVRAGISKVFDKVSLPEIARIVREYARNRHASETVFSKRIRECIPKRTHVQIGLIQERG